MNSHAVEFIGGPFDGHTQPLDDSPANLAWITGLPVSRDLIHFVTGERVKGDDMVTSIAVYQLHEDDDGLRYFYLRSVAEHECETEEA